METQTPQVWLGATQLRPLLVSVEDLEHHPENPRRGDVDTVAQSLEHFGQLKPIVAHLYEGAEKPYVVAGNHTLRGAKKIGWTHIAVVTPEIPDDQAEQFLLMDNRASDKASNDETMLAAMLQAMMDAGQLEGTGYTADDVDDLLASMDAIPTTEEQEFTGDYAESPEDTAARFTTPGEGVRMKEALLMYPEEQFEQFAAMVKALQAKWGIEGLRNVVFEALRQAATDENGEVASPEGT